MLAATLATQASIAEADDRGGGPTRRAGIPAAQTCHGSLEGIASPSPVGSDRRCGFPAARAGVGAALRVQRTAER